MFLKLPVEIRLQIYRLLLVRHYVAPWNGRSYDFPPRRYAKILRVCRLMHHEAIPVLYGENKFDMGLMRTLSAANCQFIQHTFHLPRYKILHDGIELDHIYFSKSTADPEGKPFKTLTIGVYNLFQTQKTPFAVHIGLGAGKHTSVLVKGTLQGSRGDDFDFGREPFCVRQTFSLDFPAETVIVDVGCLQQVGYELLTAFEAGGWGFRVVRGREKPMREEERTKIELVWAMKGSGTVPLST